MCRQTFFKLLLVQFFADFHGTWHTSSMSQYTKKTVEQVFEMFILIFGKFLKFRLRAGFSIVYLISDYLWHFIDYYLKSCFPIAS